MQFLKNFPKFPRHHTPPPPPPPPPDDTLRMGMHSVIPYRTLESVNTGTYINFENCAIVARGGPIGTYIQQELKPCSVQTGTSRLPMG